MMHDCEVNHGDLNGQPIKFYDSTIEMGKKIFAESPPNGESYADVKTYGRDVV